MKSETALFPEKSRDLLRRADAMMGAGLNDDAGRAAYLAGLHAAQAFIFETTRRVYRRHSGVQREFSRLVRDDPRIDVGLRTLLSRAYQLRAIADYLTGPGSHVAADTAREGSKPRGGLSNASPACSGRTGRPQHARLNQTAPDESLSPRGRGDDGLRWAGAAGRGGL